MIKRILLAATVALVPLALSGTAQAGDCYYRSSRGYGAPVVVNRGHGHHHHGYRSGYYPGDSVPYGNVYGSPYQSRAYRSSRYGYGVPYYGNRSGIGIRSGGVSLYFGF